MKTLMHWIWSRKTVLILTALPVTGCFLIWYGVHRLFTDEKLLTDIVAFIYWLMSL